MRDTGIYEIGALLSQNLRKGTKGLNDMLRLEAIQSFEERKARARRLGEEAGTKLLLPMFLMLAEVLVIVVVPAFFYRYKCSICKNIKICHRKI